MFFVLTLNIHKNTIEYKEGDKRMEMYTPDEVADILKVKDRTIRQWLRDGKLKGVKIGTHWRIMEEDLQDFIERHKKGD